MPIRQDFDRATDFFAESRAALTTARSYLYMAVSELTRSLANALIAISTHLRCESDILDGRVDLMEGEGPNDID